MRNYEVLYIVDSALNDEARKQAIEKIKTLAEKYGANNVKVNEWGIKKYAYEINFKKEGFYVLMSFTAPATAPASMTQEMRINENIVRFNFEVKE